MTQRWPSPRTNSYIGFRWYYFYLPTNSLPVPRKTPSQSTVARSPTRSLSLPLLPLSFPSLYLNKIFPQFPNPTQSFRNPKKEKEHKKQSQQWGTVAEANLLHGSGPEKIGAPSLPSTAVAAPEMPPPPAAIQRNIGYLGRRQQRRLRRRGKWKSRWRRESWRIWWRSWSCKAWVWNKFLARWWTVKMSLKLSIIARGGLLFRAFQRIAEK